MYDTQNLFVETENVKTEVPNSLPTCDPSSEKVEEESQTDSFCSACNVDCGTTELLNEHKSGIDFTCRVCGAMFSDHLELEDHLFSHKDFICKCCKQVFHLRMDLTKHKKTTMACKKKPKMFGCNLCSSEIKFKDQLTLQIHVQQTHRNTNSLHLESHTREETICVICESVVNREF